MSEQIRGVILNRKNKQQIISFHNLRWGSITPTDIDCFIDFGNKLFIIAEAKYKLSKLPGDGQQLAIERLCDSANKSINKFCYAMYLSHDVEAENDVDLASAMVFMWRDGKQWREPVKPINFLDAINILHARHIIL